MEFIIEINRKRVQSISSGGRHLGGASRLCHFLDGEQSLTIKWGGGHILPKPEKGGSAQILPYAERSGRSPTIVLLQCSN